MDLPTVLRSIPRDGSLFFDIIHAKIFKRNQEKKITVNIIRQLTRLY
jgi:hypothetical protein